MAQFCLNAIIVLDFIKDKLPKTLKEAQQLVAGDEKPFTGLDFPEKCALNIKTDIVKKISGEHKGGYQRHEQYERN